ncbi:MAG: hypothetical protein Ct9H300mP11_12890 [Chloroflexota bacterium]|nr:MAG: hypothetical protein Ct9H300mP11_12890 [Chloroflexota bacterium]
MPKFVHVYTGPEGKSVIEEKEFEMTEFLDTEGAHGLASPVEQTPGISFRMVKAGYFLDFHTAPRGSTAYLSRVAWRSGCQTVHLSNTARVPFFWQKI